MSKNIQFISLRSSISDFYEDNRITQQDIAEDILFKWGTDYAMDLIPSNYLTHRLGWLDVNNYKADKPKDLEIVLEIAYRIEKPKTCGVKGYQIVQYVQDTHEGCELEINVICPACHESKCNCENEDIIVDIGRSWEISHPELYYEDYVKVGRFGYGVSVYDPNWKILCYTDNRYHQLNKHLPGCASVHCKDCPHSYRLDTPTIETSFKQGEILIAYLGRQMDEEGNIMIPDHRDVHEAILQWLTYKHYRGEYLLKRDPSDKAISDEARFLAGQANDKVQARLRMPSFDEFSRFWAKNKWSKIDSAYSNLLNGRAPVPTSTNSRRNIYKS